MECVWLWVGVVWSLLNATIHIIIHERTNTYAIRYESDWVVSWRPAIVCLRVQCSLSFCFCFCFSFLFAKFHVPAFSWKDSFILHHTIEIHRHRRRRRRRSRQTHAHILSRNINISKLSNVYSKIYANCINSNWVFNFHKWVVNLFCRHIVSLTKYKDRMILWIKLRNFEIRFCV